MKPALLALPLALCAAAFSARADEMPAALPDLPAPLRVSPWTPERRAAARRALLEEEYGVRPVERPADLTFAEVARDDAALGGAAVMKTVRIAYGGPFGKGGFNVRAYFPKSASGPVPAFILICNRHADAQSAFDAAIASGFWPAAEIVRRGYAAVAFHCADVAPDADTGFAQGVFACFEKPEARTPASWGTLSAWAWGASRVLDWLETEPRADARQTAVVGHSRGGKAALVAGIEDARFAMVCPNDSGCGGAKLNRADLPQSEHVAQILKNFPYWFCGNFRKYAGRDAEMPFDQHQALALVAPRALAIGGASDDAWAGVPGEFLAARLASPAWGAAGLPADLALPAPGTSTRAAAPGADIQYHVREGRHDLTPFDWKQYMDFADAKRAAGRYGARD